MSDTQPLTKDSAREGWGSISAVVNAPLADVPWDASYISVIFMWLTLPLSLVQGVIAGLCKCAFVIVSIGTCCIPCSRSCCSLMGSVLAGNPLYMAWNWWRYAIGGLTALLANSRSRLALFMWEHSAFGSGDYWWHGEGVWCWSYDMCSKILMSEQARKSAFGCIASCSPDLFASGILIFLPNLADPECEWKMIRNVLHKFMLDTGLSAYKTRMGELSGLLAKEWPEPKVVDLSDKGRLQRSVAKCVFYVLFGKWVEEADADDLTGWRTFAFWFILPRLVQRFLFNIGVNKVKKLREKTVGIVEKYEVQDVFENMNKELGRWKRPMDVKFCDEIMYVVGFAGIGGTCAAVESVAAFLQCKIPEEASAKHIDFGEYDTMEKMVSAYMKNPETYIRETVRMDPPVTSATTSLKEQTTITLAGRDFEMPQGLLNQYVLSMANRDESVFPDPSKFNPDRPNLNKALTWNGAFGASNESDFPRICPGRHLSLDIVRTVIGHVLGVSAEYDRALSAAGCC